jgi:hypothetical protein
MSKPASIVSTSLFPHMKLTLAVAWLHDDIQPFDQKCYVLQLYIIT